MTPLTYSPAAHLDEEMHERGWTSEKAATTCGLAVQTIHDILGGDQRITPAIAEGLARGFGTSAAFWSNLQATWDEAGR